MAAPPARARADYDCLIKLLLIGDSGAFFFFNFESVQYIFLWIFGSLRFECELYEFCLLILDFSAAFDAQCIIVSPSVIAVEYTDALYCVDFMGILYDRPWLVCYDFLAQIVRRCLCGSFKSSTCLNAF